MMETTFYDDSRFRSKEEVKMLKRTMTLDLDANASRSSVKKQKVTSLLSSPDMHMLKLGSPELERLIINNNGLVTTTPTPTQFLFPKNVTEEQEQYARGFVDALVQLHHQNSNVEVCNTTSASTYTTLGSSTVVSSTAPQLSSLSMQQTCQTTQQLPICSTYASNSMHSMTYPPTSSSSSTFLTSVPNIKEEPQTVPSLGMTPPLSPITPINMESQEKIKLERKRLRNRIAASKCRRRKLERIARLEDKVSLLKGENSELNNVAMRLREQVAMLKQEVMDHLKSGCQIMISSSLNF